MTGNKVNYYNMLKQLKNIFQEINNFKLSELKDKFQIFIDELCKRNSIDPIELEDPSSFVADFINNFNDFVRLIGDVCNTFYFNIDDLSKYINQKSDKNLYQDLMFTLLEGLSKNESPFQLGEKILEKIVKLTKADEAYLLLIDPEAFEANIVASFQNVKFDKPKDVPEVSRKVIEWLIKKGHTQVIHNVNDEPILMKNTTVLFKDLKSILAIPLFHNENIIGALYIASSQLIKPFNDETINFLEKISNILSNYINNFFLLPQEESSTINFNEKIEKILNELNLIGNSDNFKKVINKAFKLANTEFDIFIEGESGVGKSSVAKFIHKVSSRNDKPFISFSLDNPLEIIEKNLFGYMDNSTFVSGLLEKANNGTIYLSNLEKVPHSFQNVLVNLLKNREYFNPHLQSNVKVNLRFIISSNILLDELHNKNKIKDELYYYLYSNKIYIPPLRDRIEDIIPLTIFYSQKLSKKLKKPTVYFTSEVLAVLKNYHYKGNIDELISIVENMIIHADKKITLKDIPEKLKSIDTGKITAFKNPFKLILKSSPSHYSELKADIINFKYLTNYYTEKIKLKFVENILKKANYNINQAAKIGGVYRNFIYRIIKNKPELLEKIKNAKSNTINREK